VTLTDAQGQIIPVRITDNKDKTFRVEFEAQVAGIYSANVTFGGVATPGSPYKVTVEAAVDVSKVQVKGLPQSKLISNSCTAFYSKFKVFYVKQTT